MFFINDPTARQDSTEEQTAALQEAKQNLPKNFAKNAMHPTTAEDITEISILRTRISQVEKGNEGLRSVINQMKQEEKERLNDADVALEKEEQLRDENNKLVRELEQLKADMEQQKRLKGQISLNSDLDDDGLDNAKGREEILEAIGQLERVCSAFEPGIEKVEKVEEEDYKLNELGCRLNDVEKNREDIAGHAMCLLQSVQELECRILRLEVNTEEKAQAKVKQGSQLVKRLSDAEETNQVLTEEVGSLTHSYSGLENRIDVVEGKNSTENRIDDY